MHISEKLISISSKEGISVSYPVYKDNQLLNRIEKVDLDKIRKGDKLWVETTFDDSFPMGLPLHKIIAHFPQQPKPEEKKKVELPEKFGLNDAIPSLDQVASKLNTLIDAVAQLAERIK